MITISIGWQILLGIVLVMYGLQLFFATTTTYTNVMKILALIAGAIMLASIFVR